VTPQVKTPRRRLTGIALATAAAAALAVPATGVGAVAALQDDVLATAPLSQIPERLQMVKQTKAKVTLPAIPDIGFAGGTIKEDVDINPWVYGVSIGYKF